MLASRSLKKMAQTHSFALVLLISMTGLSSTARAYYETAETGDVIKSGRYDAGLMPQFIIGNGSGANVSAFFDSGLTDATSLRILLGGGDTDFYTGASYKWIPYPDLAKQPAIGAKFEMIYAHKSSDSIVSLRVHPLISKKFEVEQGTLTPYVALPLGTSTHNSTTDVPIFLTAGTEYKNPQVKDWRFGAELGLDMNKAFSYISFFAIIDFDDGFKPFGRK